MGVSKKRGGKNRVYRYQGVDTVHYCSLSPHPASLWSPAQSEDQRCNQGSLSPGEAQVDLHRFWESPGPPFLALVSSISPEFPDMPDTLLSTHGILQTY